MTVTIRRLERDGLVKRQPTQRRPGVVDLLTAPSRRFALVAAAILGELIGWHDGGSGPRPVVELRIALAELINLGQLCQPRCAVQGRPESVYALFLMC